MQHKPAEVVAGSRGIRTEMQLDSSQLDLLRKGLADVGITPTRLADLSNTSRADVSNYLRGRFDKIGRQHRRQVEKALYDLGIVKQGVPEAPVCRYCGVEYPLGGKTG